MALAETRLSFLLHPKAKNRTKPSCFPFEDRLSRRLKSLLPIPESSTSIPLSWLSNAVDLLTQTLADAAAVFSDQSLSSDQYSIAVHLNSTIRLLDACNSVSAATDTVLSRRLLLLLALRHLSFLGDKNVSRAKDLLSEWEAYVPLRSSHHLVIPDPPPRGSISATRRAIYAVEAVSYLVIAPLSAVFGGHEDIRLGKLAVVPGEFMWSSAFNEVGAAVWGRIGEGFPGEVVAVEVSVGRLREAIDEVSDGDDGERMRNAVVVVEREDEKLTAGLHCLSDAVKGLFESTLCARDAALQNFRVRSQKCCED
ncbi:UPF0496 protein 4-like [Dendrobium catenatum]|uniref:Protein BPS1, chloroplastic n=1 Tax=Dendrobium catenatum TaxID=906689 RepID=A0A2I0WDL3_9ASPA|nr:UPF0496 protein 4-like [Dendrobium catenatum]PKU73722.1 Protein BPS1, chloroplastic [Dendrobium catenatum]